MNYNQIYNCGKNCVENADYYCNKCLHCSRTVSIIDKFIPDIYPCDLFTKTATFLFDKAIHYYTIAEVNYFYEIKPRIFSWFQ